MKRTILLVDDDPMITAGLSHMIRLAFGEGISLYTAENGGQALDLARQTHLDVVVTDIKMPGMDGLELIAALGELGCPAAVVVVSGYDDYQLVRSAMRRGAADYLLKPVKSADIADILRQLFAKSPAKAREDGGSPVGEADIVRYLISQQYPKTRLLAAALEERGMGDDTAVLPVLLRIPQGDGKAVLSRWEGLLPSEGAEVLHLEENGVHIYLLPRGAEDVLERRLDELRGSGGNAVIQVGSGGPPCPVGALPRAVALCRERLEREFFDWPEGERDGAGDGMEAHLNRATQAALRQDAEEMLAELDRFLGSAAQAAPSREFVVRSLLNWLYSLMSEMHGLIPVVSRYKLTDLDFADAVQGAYSLSALRLRLHEILRRYLDDLGSHTGDRRTRYVEKAKEYIRENLGRSFLLRDVAGHVGLHPNYFCNIFREVTGDSYRDYLRKSRIQQSIRLMETTDMKLFEIAELVGYQDAAHFSRAFKDVMGTSPNRFLRKRNDPAGRE